MNLLRTCATEKPRLWWSYSRQEWRQGRNLFLRPCARCKTKEVLASNNGRPKLCVTCDPPNLFQLRERFIRPAHRAVREAIKRGELEPATDFQCTDCDKPAMCYDHRDYSKPLDVQPVCKGCNRRRGPAVQRDYLKARK